MGAVVCAVEEKEKSSLFTGGSGGGVGGWGCDQDAQNRILLPSVPTLLSPIVGLVVIIVSTSDKFFDFQVHLMIASYD